MNKLGRLLSAMVYQNIAALIVVGMIRALFGVYGWWPNEQLNLLVGPMLNQLIPVLFGYTGGKLLGGQRGAVVAAVVTMGLTQASSVPMIIGAMAIGLFTGWLIQWIDKKLEHRLPAGFELLLANFIAAIVAVVLTLICFAFLGQVVSSFIKDMNHVLEIIVNSDWLLLSSVLIEPAKVFFFNNVINHGILAPLGIQQTKEMGKSVFFLLESNPGPGIGVLLAYWLRTTGEERKGVKTALIIHALGGVHEVYFPYVLMNLRLLFSVIAGGIAGIAVFQFFDVGLVSIASPGSILILAVLSPHDDLPFVMLGVMASALVSFLTGYMILRIPLHKAVNHTISRPNLTELGILQQTERWSEQLFEERQPPKSCRKIRTVVFSCDAGLASSSMAAALLKKKLKVLELDIHVTNSSIYEIPAEADLIITHKTLTPKARQNAPDREHMSVEAFTDMKVYDAVIARLQEEYKRH
ncbi:PTS mannitol transporter subunit IICB [Fodinisporobacter ferrooxydans]|uniref:PTS mannitol transporter subunit IICB n=1 Tax=Fodinisporobacter ferrooxydans TaxID=2901836 RepID=A0ABY4CNR1_9BACL|nr:PTS mannitol transporter subunit IICB [Alicyclobacillaceae bacterium MYW30-H2]